MARVPQTPTPFIKNEHYVPSQCVPGDPKLDVNAPVLQGVTQGPAKENRWTVGQITIAQYDLCKDRHMEGPSSSPGNRVTHSVLGRRGREGHIREGFQEEVTSELRRCGENS